MNAMEKLLNELVDRLKKTFEGRVVSVILYGSAAVGDYQEKYSDLNILCVLSVVTPRELGEVEPIFRWWREKDNPAPLLLTPEEIEESSDCFPIEFHDIRAQHRILHGADVVEGMAIDTKYHRARVEYELRSKLLRLRQKAAGVLSETPLLLRLMADSVSTFCVLLRHALILAGEEAPAAKRDTVAAAARRFGIDSKPFVTLLDLREGKVGPRDVEPVEILKQYLSQIGVMASAVSGLGA